MITSLEQKLQLLRIDYKKSGQLIQTEDLLKGYDSLHIIEYSDNNGNEHRAIVNDTNGKVVCTYDWEYEGYDIVEDGVVLVHGATTDMWDKWLIQNMYGKYKGYDFEGNLVINEECAIEAYLELNGYKKRYVGMVVVGKTGNIYILMHNSRLLHAQIKPLGDLDNIVVITTNNCLAIYNSYSTNYSCRNSELLFFMGSDLKQYKDPHNFYKYEYLKESKQYRLLRIGKPKYSKYDYYVDKNGMPFLMKDSPRYNPWGVMDEEEKLIPCSVGPKKTWWGLHLM